MNPASRPCRPLRAGVSLVLLGLLAVFTACQVTPPPPATVSLAPPPLTAGQQAVIQGQPRLARFASRLAAATGIKLVPIPAGTFVLGSPAGESGRSSDEGPPTRVTFTEDIWLSATAITQAQWTAVRGANPSHFKGATLPVEMVSKDDAMTFCQVLTDLQNTPANWEFRLPTEAQWEYACRAGTTGAEPGPVDSMAWSARNSGGTTHPVGTRSPNAWGLYDMLGNVREWRWNWYGEYPGGEVTNPMGPATGSAQVARSGGWDDPVADCRPTRRHSLPADTRQADLGFRLILAPSLLRLELYLDGQRGR